MSAGADSTRVAQAGAQRRFDYARTVALSDSVFAIALTLLVLSIGVPSLTSGHHGELWDALSDQHQQFVSYAISFVVIAAFWVRHHVFFRELDHIDARITVLNLAYLGVIAFVPYPTQVLGRYGDQPAAVAFYAVVIALVASLAALMRRHALRAELLTAAGRREVEQGTAAGLYPVAVFLLSVPVAFLSTTAAELMWLALALGLNRWRHRSPPD